MAYEVRDGDGRVRDPGEAIFPIVKQVGRDLLLVGTGFFICNIGVFVTAKHVLFDVLDESRNQISATGAIQFIANNNYIVRPVIRCCSNDASDIAVGVLARTHHNVTRAQLTNPVMTLTFETPVVGTPILTYAYPESDMSERTGHRQLLRFRPKFYEGLLEEVLPDGRDRVVIPFPCYRGSIKILGGASGGPVCNDKGRVIGVNCTGFDGTNISYFARINEIIPLYVNDVQINGEKFESVSIKRFIEQGQIAIDPPAEF